LIKDKNLSVDLNTLTGDGKYGIYAQPVTNRATLENHYPVVKAGSFLSLPAAHGRGVQLYITIEGGLYSRSTTGPGVNDWSNWTGYVKKQELDSLLAVGVPQIGVPFFWPSTAMPNTVMDEWSDMVFLKPNGASFSAATYPKLAKVWTGLIIPDMRGEFPRIWDDGRGVDSGRTLLSAQGDAIRNITGSINGVVNYQSGAATGAFTNPSSGNSVNLTTGQSGVGNPNFDASRVVPTANENRPRNIAFNFLVRAK
ncbi:TPA: hypothetical protein U2L30_005377, partial [Citrobacter farmeri]|nr:hypothetical protein [Citrobacter farmeri]